MSLWDALGVGQLWVQGKALAAGLEPDQYRFAPGAQVHTRCMESMQTDMHASTHLCARAHSITHTCMHMCAHTYMHYLHTYMHSHAHIE